MITTTYHNEKPYEFENVSESYVIVLCADAFCRFFEFLIRFTQFQSIQVTCSTEDFAFSLLLWIKLVRDIYWDNSNDETNKEELKSTTFF